MTYLEMYMSTTTNAQSSENLQIINIINPALIIFQTKRKRFRSLVYERIHGVNYTISRLVAMLQRETTLETKASLKIVSVSGVFFLEKYFHSTKDPY